MKSVKSAPDFCSVDDIGRIAGALFGSELSTDRLRLLRLDHAWGRAVGAHVRAVSSLSSCSAGCLLVDVRDARWKQELERLKPDIIARLSAILPASPVRDIAFRVRRSTGGGTPVSPTAQPAPFAPPHAARTPEISEEPLAERLNRVMGRYLALAR